MGSDVHVSLGYRDAAAAIRFLTDLGFAQEVLHDDDGLILHAELSWPSGGTVHIHSATPDGNSVADVAERAAQDGGYPGVSVHIDVSDPDALYARALEAGATVVRELQDSPHGIGTRGFVIADPEGLHWSFGTPLPELVRGSDGRWRPRDATT